MFVASCKKWTSQLTDRRQWLYRCRVQWQSRANEVRRETHHFSDDTPNSPCHRQPPVVGVSMVIKCKVAPCIFKASCEASLHGQPGSRGECPYPLSPKWNSASINIMCLWLFYAVLSWIWIAINVESLELWSKWNGVEYRALAKLPGSHTLVDDVTCTMHRNWVKGSYN